MFEVELSLSLRGRHCEDFSLTRSVDPTQQDAIDAVVAVRALLESGQPNAFPQAIEVLMAVSIGAVAGCHDMCSHPRDRYAQRIVIKHNVDTEESRLWHVPGHVYTRNNVPWARRERLKSRSPWP